MHTCSHLGAISADPIPGRVPVGIVYDISGKMMSIAEFGGEDKCASLTADGTKDWTLASMEDMGIIKANVSKINTTIAKISSEAAKITITGDFTSSSAVYKTTNGNACMASNINISGTGYDGCYKSLAYHSRCIRSFGAGGANDGQATEAAYKVGDSYKDTDGNVIGTVVSVDSSGQH